MTAELKIDMKYIPLFLKRENQWDCNLSTLFFNVLPLELKYHVTLVGYIIPNIEISTTVASQEYISGDTKVVMISYVTISTKRQYIPIIVFHFFVNGQAITLTTLFSPLLMWNKYQTLSITEYYVEYGIRSKCYFLTLEVLHLNAIFASK